MANSGSSFSTTDIILTGVGGAAGLLTILACIYWRYCRARGVGETQPLLSSTTPPNNALRNDATVSSSAPPSSPPPPPITATSTSVNATTDSLPFSPPPPPPPQATSTPTQPLTNTVVVNVNGTDQPVTQPVVADVLSFMKASNVPVTNATVDSAAILQEINNYINNGDKVYLGDAKNSASKLLADLKPLETASSGEVPGKVKNLIKYIDSCITLLSKSLLDGDERYKKFGCVLYKVTALPDIKEMGDRGISFKAAYVRLQDNLYYAKSNDKNPAWKCVKTNAAIIQTIDQEMKRNSIPLFLPPEDLQKITSLTGHSHIMHQYHAALISARKKIKETFNYENVNSVAQSRQSSPPSTPRVVTMVNIY
ncbi:hypothetical protein AYO45_01530 [Gammaproteobacteria bacterium SCGC AG-212-F23]|nr:hypothetical protein AYO45_01530 [Gammaproteobacteria bacterium SCGC AG-212-F23]